MAVTTATVVAAGAAAASAGVSYAGYASNKQAQEESAAAAEQAYAAQSGLLGELPSGEELGLEEIAANIQPYEPFNILKFGQKAATGNINLGIPAASQAASKVSRDVAGQAAQISSRIASSSNQQAVADVEAAMAQLFGGADALNAQRGLVNQNVQDWLSGNVSQSTRQELSRSALASGADLGEGAVNDLFTGYLGLTKEAVASQGVEAYQSLYSMYQKAAPIVSQAEMFAQTYQPMLQNFGQVLPLTTLSPADAIQSEMYNRLNTANSSLGAAGLQLDAAESAYTADLNKALGLSGVLSNQASLTSQNAALSAANNNQLAQGISSSLGSLAGLAMSSSKSGVTGLNTTNAGAMGNYGSTYVGSYNGQPVYKPQTLS